MSDPLVSIIMRSFNEGWSLRETLPALRNQEYRNWELIVIDSGSTDGSVELIRGAKPSHFVQIAPHEYQPARVMNQGMQLARSDYGIFLNADATPQGADWLRPLVAGLFDPNVAAVFGRQIPRPDCQAVYAHDYERCFGLNRSSARWDHFFSMASSGIRKDIWAKRGFNERMQYSEDDEYTRWCRAQGYRVEYVPESVAMHSHNYTPAQAWKRSYGEGRALAAVWSGPETTAARPEIPPLLGERAGVRGALSNCSPTGGDAPVSWFRSVILGWANDLRRDLGYCARNRRLNEWLHAARIRWQQRRGKFVGFKVGWNDYRQSDVSEKINPPVWAETKTVG